jgi:hypothetical protein
MVPIGNVEGGVGALVAAAARAGGDWARGGARRAALELVHHPAVPSVSCQLFCYSFSLCAEDPRERDYLKTILHRIYGVPAACDAATAMH